MKLNQDFPVPSSCDELRDKFAIAALTGLIATRHPDYHGEDGAEVLSNDAYMIADAMLVAREQQ